MTAWVTIPKSALDWLFGDGPDASGKWFGDILEEQPASGKYPRTYWWRTHFRKLLAAASPPTGAGERIRDADAEAIEAILAAAIHDAGGEAPFYYIKKKLAQAGFKIVRVK